MTQMPLPSTQACLLAHDTENSNMLQMTDAGLSRQVGEGVAAPSPCSLRKACHPLHGHRQGVQGQAGCCDGILLASVLLRHACTMLHALTHA